MRPLLYSVICCAAIALGCARSPTGGGGGSIGVRYPGLPSHQEGALHIVNFNVGQAEALLMVHDGKTLLLDAGSPLHERRRIARELPPRLQALSGRRHIDYLLISHYHQDHLGSPGSRKRGLDPAGLYALLELEGITVGTLLYRGFWTLGEPTNTQKHFMTHSARWLKTGQLGDARIVRAEDRVSVTPGLELQIVSASGNGLLDAMHRRFPDFIEEASPSENDYSVGVKVDFGDFELFSAGDLSGRNVIRQYGPRSETYTDIESHVADRVGAVEFYRVNHHGSRHSTNECFAATLRPRVSVFSTGANTYGHPAPEVYQRLKAYGDVYITGGADERYREQVEADIVGADVEILVAPDGSRFWVNGKPYVSQSDALEQTSPADACAKNLATLSNYERDTLNGYPD